MRELFVRTCESEFQQFFAVPAEPSVDVLEFGEPAFLFEGDYRVHTQGRNFEVTRNGEHFLLITRQPMALVDQLELLEGWFGRPEG